MRHQDDAHIDIDLVFRPGLTPDHVSDEERALIDAILAELLVELMAGGADSEGNGDGGSTLRTGLDQPTGGN